MTFESQPDTSGLPTAQFDVVMRGYDRSQVDEHIARLHEEMRHLAAGLRQERDLALTRSHQLAAERDNALEHLYATQDELEALRNESGGAAQAAAVAQPQAQQVKGDQIALFGDRLQTILATAEQEASAAKAEALEEALRARDEAKKEAESTLADAKRRADEMLAQAREKSESMLQQTRQQAEQITAKAHQQAASTLESVTRDERDAKANVAKLLTRREQVRSELSKISQAIQGLLTDEQGAQRADNGQTGAAAGAKQEQPDADKADKQERSSGSTPDKQERSSGSTPDEVRAQDQR